MHPRLIFLILICSSNTVTNAPNIWNEANWMLGQISVLYFIRMAVLKSLLCTGASDSWICYVTSVWNYNSRHILKMKLNRFSCMVGMKNGYKYPEVPIEDLHRELGLQILVNRGRDLVVLHAPWAGKRKIGLSWHPSPDHFQVTFIYAGASELFARHYYRTMWWIAPWHAGK